MAGNSWTGTVDEWPALAKCHRCIDNAALLFHSRYGVKQIYEPNISIKVSLQSVRSIFHESEGILIFGLEVISSAVAAPGSGFL